MFKKLVSSILMLSLMFCLNPFNEISAEQFVNVQDSAESASFSMSHVVARDSFFKTLVETSKITKAGSTKLDLAVQTPGNGLCRARGASWQTFQRYSNAN